MFLPKVSKNLHMSFGAMAHLAEWLYLNALLMLKVENSLVCYVGTNTSSIHNGMAIYFALKKH
jgi:hypothetical protein